MRFIGPIFSSLIIIFTVSVGSAAELNTSIVKLQVRSPDGGNNCYSSEGAAFFMNSLSRLHTAAHVLYKCGSSQIKKSGSYYYVDEIIISNLYFSEPLKLYNVKLLKYDLESDHAILDLTLETHKFPYQLSYLRSSKQQPQTNEVTYSAGFANHSPSLVVMEGRFIEVLPRTNKIMEYAVAVDMQQGQSGGPTVNHRMEVIGLNRSRVNSSEGRVVNLLN